MAEGAMQAVAKQLFRSQLFRPHFRAQTSAARAKQSDADLTWSFWPLLPLYPYGKRRTIRREVVKGEIWTFDQQQGIFYVVVPIRMTVAKINGGLLVYAPVAPTRECVRLVRELEAKHGPVKYIILPTVSGLEHKVFVPSFARRFPQAQVYVASNQWSFPVNLPLSWLGFPRQRTHVLPRHSSQAPFADEFDYQVLGPISLGLGPFEEVAFFHRRSRTLLVTDSVLSIPADPPEIVQIDPYPLLFHARDLPSDAIADSAAARRKGWQRVILFSFYFRPESLEVASLSQSIRDAAQAPDRSKRAYFGLYPFQWQDGWQDSFEALRGDGRLLVAPILRTLILNRAPKQVIDWAEQVAQWHFQRIIPCHLQSPIVADAEDFRQAFEFLKCDRDSIPAADLEFLRALDVGLSKSGITPPAKDYRP